MKVTEEMRRLLECLAAQMTLKRRRRFTLTDVMEESIRLLAKREKVV